MLTLNELTETVSGFVLIARVVIINIISMNIISSLECVCSLYTKDMVVSPIEPWGSLVCFRGEGWNEIRGWLGERQRCFCADYIWCKTTGRRNTSTQVHSHSIHNLHTHQYSQIFATTIVVWIGCRGEGGELNRGSEIPIWIICLPGRRDPLCPGSGRSWSCPWGCPWGWDTTPPVGAGSLEYPGRSHGEAAPGGGGRDVGTGVNGIVNHMCGHLLCKWSTDAKLTSIWFGFNFNILLWVHACE